MDAGIFNVTFAGIFLAAVFVLVGYIGGIMDGIFSLIFSGIFLAAVFILVGSLVGSLVGNIIRIF